MQCTFIIYSFYNLPRALQCTLLYYLFFQISQRFFFPSSLGRQLISSLALEPSVPVRPLIKKTPYGVYFICRWPGSNRHVVAYTRFWVWHVYQFHHIGLLNFQYANSKSKKNKIQILFVNFFKLDILIVALDDISGYNNVDTLVNCREEYWK